MSALIKSTGIILAYVAATVVGAFLGLVIALGIIALGAWLV